MGQKVNPKAFRLNSSVNWSSLWFNNRDYADMVRKDVDVRKFLKKKLKEASVERIEIESRGNDTTVNITAARPGVIIGRGGAGIEGLKAELVKKFFPKQPNVKINIKEVDNPNLSAEVVLQSMVADIEKRMPFRRVLKQAIDRVMKAGAQGVKVRVAGRLNGAEIARAEKLTTGRVPLQTIRADIDYARAAAHTTYGAIGVKVWIYRGDVFEKEKAAKAAPRVVKNYKGPKE